jgi:hypothetical protein
MSNSSARQSGPFEEQRRVYELLSQETRHLILQNVLGHPKNLPSLGELNHVIPKSTGAISDQLDRLVEADILAEYTYEESADARDLPSQFYGMTESGVEVLAEYNYLRGLPLARAVYRNTRKPDRIERHESAPRPELPDSVADALTDGKSSTESSLAERLRARNEGQDSLADQITVAETVRELDAGPEADGVTRSKLHEQVGHELAFDLSTVLENLTETELVERVEPAGPTTFAIDERSDEIVNGAVGEAAEQNLSALQDHLDSEIYTTPSDPGATIAVADGAGRTVRHVLAEAFDVPPVDVSSELDRGDPVETLNSAVRAIKADESVESREGYGQIVFRSAANRYRLTETAVAEENS